MCWPSKTDGLGTTTAHCCYASPERRKTFFDGAFVHELHANMTQRFVAYMRSFFFLSYVVIASFVINIPAERGIRVFGDFFLFVIFCYHPENDFADRRHISIA